MCSKMHFAAYALHCRFSSGCICAHNVHKLQVHKYFSSTYQGLYSSFSSSPAFIVLQDYNMQKINKGIIDAIITGFFKA